MHEWVDGQAKTDLGKYICETTPRANGCAGPSTVEDVSMLHRLWCWKNSDPDEGPEAKLIHGGMGQVPALLVKELKSPVSLGDPVVSIRQAGGMATVTTLSGKSLNASNLVVAMPPYISGQNQYDP